MPVFVNFRMPSPKVESAVNTFVSTAIPSGAVKAPLSHEVTRPPALVYRWMLRFAGVKTSPAASTATNSGGTLPFVVQAVTKGHGSVEDVLLVDDELDVDEVEDVEVDDVVLLEVDDEVVLVVVEVTHVPSTVGRTTLNSAKPLLTTWPLAYSML